MEREKKETEESQGKGRSLVHEEEERAAAPDFEDRGRD